MFVFYVFILLILSCVVQRTTGLDYYTISSFAGDARIYNTYYDGYPALSAFFDNPGPLWGNTNGVMYVVQTNRIRKILSDRSNVTSISKLSTYYSDIWGDTNGYLFLPSGSSVLKMDSTTGAVTTFATSLVNVNGLTGDTSGNIYVAIYSYPSNCFVAKITPGGVRTNIIGNGNCQSSSGLTKILATTISLNLVEDVWIDTVGNVFVTDNVYIHKVNSSGYVVKALNYYPPMINAFRISSDNTFMYLPLDSTESRVFKIPMSDLSTVGVAAGVSFSGACRDEGDGGLATSAYICRPYGTFVDSGGQYLYISTNSKIRRVLLSSGIITTYAGVGSLLFGGDNSTSLSTARFCAITGLLLDTTNNVLYISDYSNFRIRKISLSTNTLTTIAGSGVSGSTGDDGAATSATLAPNDLQIDTVNSFLYFTQSASTCKVRRINLINNIISTYAGSGSCASANSGQALTSIGLDTPRSIWFNTTSNVMYVSTSKYIWSLSNGIGTIIVGNGLSTQVSNVDGLSTGINTAYSICGDTSGNLYYADYGNNNIRKISSSNIVTTLVTLPTSPIVIYYDVVTNQLFISEQSTCLLKAFSVVTQTLATIAGKGSCGSSKFVYPLSGAATSVQLFSYPRGITGDTAGNIYISEGSSYSARIVKLTKTLAPSPTSQPSGQPSRQPSSQPSRQPTRQPSQQPTRQPTTQPSRNPTTQPSRLPSRCPTSQPTSVPSRQPSSQPSCHPTRQPVLHPTSKPSSHPTRRPTSQPFGRPSTQPSSQPSSQPSRQPLAQPTGRPSSQPTMKPTSPTSKPSSQPSLQPIGSPTSKPSNQPTMQPVNQPSTQPSIQPTMQPSSKPSGVPSARPSTQPSTQPSLQPISGPSAQPTHQPIGVPSSQPSRQPMLCPSSQPSNNPSSIPTRCPSCQPSAVPSSQPSAIPSTVPSSDPTVQPSAQPISKPSGVPSRQPSAAPSFQPTSSPTAQPSSVPSCQPSTCPTVQPSQQPSCFPSGQPTQTPSSQPSLRPSVCPSSQPSVSPTTQPSEQPSGIPTSIPSRQPVVAPTSYPSSCPSRIPSGAPTSTPSLCPSSQPSLQPAGRPTSQPSTIPSKQPSSLPTTIPSLTPSSSPSSQPSKQPTGTPTGLPSKQPLARPSRQPSGQPSSQPSQKPTDQPTRQPNCSPTRQPSTQPSSQPSVFPTSQPFSRPSTQPSSQPTQRPTTQPSTQPSRQPALRPTGAPTCSPSRKPSSQPSSSPTINHMSCVNTTYYSPEGNTCLPCPLQSFNKQAGSTTCSCLAGRVAVASELALECSLCAAGKFSNYGDLACSNCPTGSFSVRGSGSCTLCPLNYYNDQVGKSTCRLCPNGRTTAITGANSVNQCVSPIPNFTLGFIALGTVIIIFSWYIVFGKFHRLSFERKTKIVLPAIEKCKKIIFFIQDASKNKVNMSKTEQQNDEGTIAISRWKQFRRAALFFFLVAVIILVYLILYYVAIIYQVFFTTLILYRGMKLSFPSLSPVLTVLAQGLKDLSSWIGLPFALAYYLASPFLYLFSALASLNLNLDTVNITCQGSQAPIELFIDCSILGLVIVFIRSDYQILFNILLIQLNSNYLSHTMDRALDRFRQQQQTAATGNALGGVFSKLFVLGMFMTAFNSINPVQLLLRYAMGFLNLAVFVEDHHLAHRVSPSCNNVPSAPYFDSILGYSATVFAWWLILPTLYTISEVIVAKSVLPRNKQGKGTSAWCGKHMFTSVTPGVDPESNHRDIADENYIDEAIVTDQDGVDVMKETDVEKHEREKQQLIEDLQLMMTARQLPDEVTNEFRKLIEAHEKASKAAVVGAASEVGPPEPLTHWAGLFRFVRDGYTSMVSVDIWISSLIALWVDALMKHIVPKVKASRRQTLADVFANKRHNKQEEHAETHGQDEEQRHKQPDAVDSPVKFLSQAGKKSSMTRSTRMMHALAKYGRKKHEEKQQLDQLWLEENKRTKSNKSYLRNAVAVEPSSSAALPSTPSPFLEHRLPSYYKLCMLVRDELHHGYVAEPMATVLAFFGLGHPFTKKGRYFWKIALNNYKMFLLAAFGIWTDEAVEAFNLPELSRRLTVSRRPPQESPRMNDAATIVAQREAESDRNDVILPLIQVSLTTRVILFQMIPSLVIVSTVTAALSSFPLFVSNTQFLQRAMPPVTLWGLELTDMAIDKELKKLRIRSVEDRAEARMWLVQKYKWRICLQRLILFWTESRLFQLMHALLILSLSFVFLVYSEKLLFCIVVILAMLVPFACMNALQIVLYLGKAMDICDEDLPACGLLLAVAIPEANADVLLSVAASEQRPSSLPKTHLPTWNEANDEDNEDDEHVVVIDVHEDDSKVDDELQSVHSETDWQLWQSIMQEMDLEDDENAFDVPLPGDEHYWFNDLQQKFNVAFDGNAVFALPTEDDNTALLAQDNMPQSGPHVALPTSEDVPLTADVAPENMPATEENHGADVAPADNASS